MHERYKSEELIVPTFPSYKRRFVEEIGNYLCSRFDFISSKFDFRKLNPKKIHALNSKRKLSSAGVKIMDYASNFLDEEVNPDRLNEAVKILSKGISDLENYEVTDGSLAAVHGLRGYADIPPLSGIVGGRAPIEGELREKKPSGYSSFTLPKDTSKEYLNSLRKTLFESLTPLEEGFKSEERDKNFEVLIKSSLSREDLNLVHVRTVNDYVRSVHGHAYVTCKLAKYFEESGLTGLHKLSRHEKLKKLKDAEFKIMHPLTEKVSLYASKYQVPIMFAGLFGGVGIIALGNSYLAGFCFTVGSTTIPLFLNFNSFKIKKDRQTLRRIENLRCWTGDAL